ncbi:hypothetical protein [Mesorhizobium sp. ZC-5]|uniref:hypothetical protein n=1 Tax=Mesorhizobium sp. ZC-5 TaxID=2986066 RepID=UPI0021E953CF|nr:hypothetical protein [Mesorhizobium sp. ZC-5]MCV3243812.1 hypothetical protein [Mesorhizobium sp. ZC-5]
MRTFAALLALGCLLPGAAQASSILVLGDSTADPSIVTLGAASGAPSIVAMGTAGHAGSPSIIALGREPGVAYENVAAIGDDAAKSKTRRNDPMMVIRGGIVGDAFTRGSGMPASPVPSKMVPIADTPAQQPQSAAAKQPEEPEQELR